MRREHLKHLCCPTCEADLRLESDETGECVERGLLVCAGICGSSHPIVGGIPRFVPAENYAGSFGFQWAIHAKTQYDSYNGSRYSEERFFNETKWPRQMEGELILEVGGGGGRFTEQASSTGAMVVSLDYSAAVESNYAHHGDRANVLIVQGDAYRMPFRRSYFDRLYCFGVLQHTPDVERTFKLLPHYLRPGGHLAVDVYKAPRELRNRLFATKYWARHLTKRIPPKYLYPLTKRYVQTMWPLTGVIYKAAGNWINWLLLVSEYRGIYDLPDEILREWAILDTFDGLSPAFDTPQHEETLRRWFEEARLEAVEVHEGYNGIEGRGRRPAPTAD